MSELAIDPEELAQLMGTEPETTVEPMMPPPSPPQPAKTEEAPLPSPIAAPSDLGVTARPAQFAPLEPSVVVSSNTNLEMLLGVTLRVTVELGRTSMSIDEILKLGPGSVVELDKLAGEPVDVLVNGRLIARGEVVVVDDRFGVRITDVLPPAQRINSLR